MRVRGVCGASDPVSERDGFPVFSPDSTRGREPVSVRGPAGRRYRSRAAEPAPGARRDAKAPVSEPVWRSASAWGPERAAPVWEARHEADAPEPSAREEPEVPAAGGSAERAGAAGEAVPV